MALGNVYIVDDDQSVCESLSLFLRVSGFTPQIFNSGSDMLSYLEKVDPGCMLLDVRMPDIDGFGVLSALGEASERLAVIVMTGHGDIATAVRAMRAGAVDFIEKPFEEELILQALARASETLDDKVKLSNRRQNAISRFKRLTAREIDVLNGIIDGKPNKVLAYDLGVSTRTVEMHRSNLMDRLGATSAAQVVRLAYEAGRISRHISFSETSGMTQRA